MIWIGYTTTYREGGRKFELAAQTLAARKRADHPGTVVSSQAVDSKRHLVEAMERVRDGGESLRELHFVGHSGMYGPMFRTRAMPEQFSPHEWRNLQLPFAPGAHAYFHACRTARWFAPFFARTFGVTAHGYHWYTTVSRAPDRFVWDGPGGLPTAPLYVIACPGRKSHGALGSLMKVSGLARAEPMKAFEPREPEGDPSYDGVAALYDLAFDDVGVRADEWRWLQAHLPTARLPAAGGARPPRVLDLGCGNGGLLTKLAGRIGPSAGVDKSARMVALARQRATGLAAVGLDHLSFEVVDGPTLPFPDRSFDVVVSLLSFRYLDWDPVMNEIRRVLAPGGRLLIVDMVTAPLASRELPAFARSKARELLQRKRNPAFQRALQRLVGDPRWHTMLKYNPIRAEHELRWYLESRFPGKPIELLNVGWKSRILAFDSGPLQPGWTPPQSYP